MRLHQMADSWNIPKPLGYLAAVATACVAIGGAWKAFDLPVPASRVWVLETLRPYQEDSMSLLQVRRIVAVNELFLWESNQVIDGKIKSNIERLKAEIADIDRRLQMSHAR